MEAKQMRWMESKMMRTWKTMQVAMLAGAVLFGATPAVSEQKLEAKAPGAKVPKGNPSVPSLAPEVAKPAPTADAMTERPGKAPVPRKGMKPSTASKGAPGILVPGATAVDPRARKVAPGGRLDVDAVIEGKGVRHRPAGRTLDPAQLPPPSRVRPGAVARPPGSSSGPTKRPGSGTERPDRVDAPRSGFGPPSAEGGGTGAPDQRVSPAGKTAGFGDSAGGPTPAQAGRDVGGSPSYRLGNGQSVPRDLGGGVTGKPNETGGVDYSDGRAANPDPLTGETVFSNADGSVDSRHRPAQASVSSEGQKTWTLSNGQQVPRTDDAGNPIGRPNGSGGVTSKDGTSASVDPATGETVFRGADGNETARYDAPRAHEHRDGDGNQVFRMTNGRLVPRADGDGGVGKSNPSGGVDYPDGTSINPREGGGSVVHRPNGESYVGVEQATQDGQEVFDLGNGTSVPAKGAGGNGRLSGDGSRVLYEDGTVVFVDAATGETVVLNPDGSERSRRSGAGSDGYVADTSRDSDSSSNGSKDGDDSSSSGSSDDDSDDSEDSKDEDSSDDSSDDEGDDSSDDGSGDDGSGDDDSGEEGGADEMGGAGSEANQPEARKVVDGFVAEKSGERKTPEEIGPPDCEEGSGPGPVVDPVTGETGGCVPAGMKGSEGEETPRPQFVEPSGTGGGLGPEAVINPTGIDEPIDESLKGSLDQKLEDIEGVTNPGP